MSRGSGPVTKIERFEMDLVAKESLARVMRPEQVVRGLMDEFTIDRALAQKIVRAAERDLLKALDTPADARRRRVIHEERLEALYRAAFTSKRYTVCATILQQIARLHGLDVQKLVIDSPVKPDDFENRSEAELLYFASHGVWPTAADLIPPSPEDPLAGLH